MKVTRTIYIYIVVCVLTILCEVNMASADLNLIGQGTTDFGTYNLIYDTDLNITWLDYTHFADKWQNQLNWAENLSVNFGDTVLTNWRLPRVADPDPNCSFVGNSIYPAGSPIGPDCYGSEMGHVYYNEPGGFGSEGIFENMLLGRYWYESVYFSSNTYSFNLSNGFQGGADGGGGSLTEYYAVAVHPGDGETPLAPEPISSILFVAGGTLLAGRRYIKRKKKA